MSLERATWERVVAPIRWPRGILIAAAFQDGRAALHSSSGSWIGTVSGEVHWDQIAERPRAPAEFSFRTHAFYDPGGESVIELSLGWFFGDRVSTRRLDATGWTTTELPQALDYDPLFDPAIYEPRGGRIMVLGWDSVPWVLAPWSEPGWRRFGSPESSPFPRTGHAVAFDPLFDRVLVIGGIEDWTAASPAGSFVYGGERQLVSSEDGNLISVAPPAEDPTLWRIDLTSARCLAR